MDVDKTARNVESLRRQLGLALFTGFSPDNFPVTTLPALAFVAAATRVDRDEEASYRIRDALWEEGLDVGSEAVVSEIAANFGFTIGDDDRQAALDDYEEGQRRGVKGSPHFFCGNRDEFCPSLELARTADGELVIKPDPYRLEEFLEGCWR